MDRNFLLMNRHIGEREPREAAANDDQKAEQKDQKAVFHENLSGDNKKIT
jgi:hypothetical protein